jgi:peptidyl-prolyl cis-trans isomerase B (cyclophilin B)
VLQLDAAKAPRTVNSFVFLAGKNYFDNAPCHRLSTVNPFVVQCGDPVRDGLRWPRDTSSPTRTSRRPAQNNYPAGTLAMANAGKGTNGSQFFLVYRDTTLGPDYTVFGKLVAGQDVLDKIRAGGVAGGREDGNPMTKVSILDVTTTKGTP